MQVFSKYIIRAIKGSIFMITDILLRLGAASLSFFNITGFSPIRAVVNDLSSSVSELDDSFLVI